jgi:hypothetical protein
MRSNTRRTHVWTPILGLSLATLATLVALLLAASPASASLDDIISDCADDGRVDSGYSVDELRRARRKLPADVREYTDCYDAIGAAIKARTPRAPGVAPGFGGGGGGTGSGAFGLPDTPGYQAGAGGAAPTIGDSFEMGDIAGPSNEELAAADEASKDGSAVDVGGKKVTPGATAFDVGELSNALPKPLLVTLIVIGAGAFLVVLVVVGGRILGRGGGVA